MNRHFLLAKMLMIMTFTGLLSVHSKSSVYAQVATNYSFSQFSGTYTPITGGTLVATASVAASQDDLVYNGVIPFNFVFDGNVQTDVRISTNGFITFGTTAPGTTNYAPISSATAYAGAVSPFGRDLQGGYATGVTRTSGSNTITVSNVGPITVGSEIAATGFPAGTTVTSIAGTTLTMSNNATATATNVNTAFFGSWSNIREETIGSAPNRIYVVQWSNWRRFGTTAGTTQDMLLNFQVRLYESDNGIEIVYGDCSPGVSTFTTVSHVGVRGPNNTFATNVNNRLNVKGTNDNWLNSNPGTTNASGMLFNNVAPANVIPSGLTYRWEVPICAGTPDEGTAAISASSGCNGISVTLSATGLSGGNGISYQWQSSPDGIGSWADIAGATSTTSVITTVSGTTFYRLRTQCSNSGLENFTSNSVSYDSNLSGLCACGTYPAIFASSAADTEISNVTVGSMNNSSTCATVAPGAGSILNRYSNYTSSVAGPSEMQGAPVAFSLTQTSCGGNFNNGFQMYIDWNQDGDFLDAGEQVYVQPAAINGTHTVTGTFTVPPTALVGTTRMRIVVAEGYSNSTNFAHTAYTFGETEDYCFEVLPSIDCAGTPDPGTVSISNASGCPSTNFTLSAAGAEIGTGIVYQWQSSPDGNAPWTNISGANNPTLVTSTPTLLFYRMQITCSLSNEEDFSNVVSYTPEGDFCQCASYCSPVNNTGACISNVTFNTLNNSTGCSAGPSYYTFESATTSVVVGSTHTLSVSTAVDPTYPTAITSVWIDWNQNGVFEASEWFQPYTNAVTGSVSVIVPVDAVLGTTRMRVRSRGAGNPNGANDACVSMGSGETEDYCITIIAAVDCAGTPDAGTGSISTSIGCPNAMFNLNATDVTFGTGITYQWQTSPDGVGSWTDIPGATTVAYSTSTATTAYYRLVTTCTISNESNNSNVVSYTVTGGLCECGAYSSNFASNAADTEIASVTVGTMTNNLNTCSVAAPGPGSIAGRYSNFTTSVAGPSEMQGATVNFNVTQLACGVSQFTNVIQIYVDWNQDGVFDVSERMAESTAGTNVTPGFSGTFEVPFAALTGTTRMRIVCAETTVLGSNYAQNAIFTWGETEDYCFTVMPGADCAGTPAPGNTLSTLPNPCISDNFTLSLQNQTTGFGVSYQWQTSTNGVDWTNAGAAPNAPTWTTNQASATWYRCVVTCGPSTETTASNGVLLGSSICFCEAQYSSGKTLGDLISNVEIPGTALANNSGTAQVNPAYTYFTGQPNFTADLVQGGSYNVTISVGTWGNQHIRAWIDYNDNGIFEASESIGSSIIAPGSGNTGPFPPAIFPVNLSMSAPLGTHRMRIRGVWQSTPSMTFASEIDPCISYGFGETEDYDITIVAPVTSQLQSNFCNISGVTMDMTLRAVNVNAPAYRFRIVGPNNGGQGWLANTFILDRPSRDFKFSQVPGSLWGSMYTIDVAVGDGFGNYGPYGATCTVTMLPSIPTTQLVAANCNSINVDPAVNLLAVAVTTATGYRFQVNGPGVAPNTTVTKTMGGGAMRKLKMQEIAGILPGETYTVEVAIRDAAGNWGAYGTACTVTLMGAPDMVINDNLEMIQTRDLTAIEFGVSASHNPFTTEFGLQVLNANDTEMINVAIYDMSGKLIERHAINPMDIEAAQFGSNLASGMYMVEVKQGLNQAVVRQVKN